MDGDANPVRFLFVDDEVMILRALARVVRDEPYDVRFTDDVEETRRVIVQGEVDVFVCDKNMPHCDGVSLLALATEAEPMIVRVLLSGDNAPAESRQLLLDGVADFVVDKPWGFLALRELRRVAASMARARRSRRVSSH